MVPHHVTGKKNGDRDNLVPCSYTIHSQIHDHGYGWFEERHGVSKEDFIAEAKRIDAMYVEYGGEPFV